MNKFCSIFSRKSKEKFHQIDQENQVLQKHWSDVMLGIKKSFLPLPSEVEFGISIIEVKGLKEELNEIHKRLSTLELMIHVG